MWILIKGNTEYPQTLLNVDTGAEIAFNLLPDNRSGIYFNENPLDTKTTRPIGFYGSVQEGQNVFEAIVKKTEAVDANKTERQSEYSL